MVEVTNSNFDEMLPFIEKAIKNSTFIAIDTEFTGLFLGSSNESNLFDSPQERYEKLKCRATSFIPCQIGLSTFTKAGKENSYSAETYVFYIRPCMVGSIDKKFMCQASSIDFLSRYGFDFEKFANEGIPYINENEEVQVCNEIKDGTIGRSHEKLMDFRYRRELDIKIDTTLFKSLKNHCINKNGAESSEDGKRLVLPIDKISHVYFQLNELRRKYPSLWAYTQDGMIVVEIVSPEKRKELEKNTAFEEERLLDYFLGFTKVFRLLKEVQKPIVGHNLLMDLMLFYQNFHQHLPVSYKVFKNELHKVFPVIFDTRHMWLNIRTVHKFKQLPRRSALFDVYEILKNPIDDMSTLYSPDIQPSNCKKYVSGNFPHESGYDAYVTGWIFLKTCHLLAMKKISNPLLIRPQTIDQLLKAVSTFVNRINLGHSLIRYFNLGGSDPLPEVSEFLYVSPRDPNGILIQEELARIFDKYPMVEFKCVKQQRGAIVAVGSIGCYKDILRDFKDDPDYVVQKYRALRHSPYFNSALWLAAVTSGCILAVLITKYITN